MSVRSIPSNKWIVPSLVAVMVMITSATAVAHQADLRSVLSFSPQTVGKPAPMGTPCDAGTAGIIIHDDGSAENGYSFNIGSVTEGRFVDRFTPSSYPATFSSVCFSFVTLDPNITSFDFDVVIYAADGDNGSPGTLLATKPVVVPLTLISGLPFTPIFQPIDISDLALYITAGDVYIGADWHDRTDEFAYLAADESSTTPLAGGQLWSDDTFLWHALGIDVNFEPNYRALMVRAVEAPANAPGVVLAQAFSPPTILDSRTSALTITLENQTNADATLQSGLIDLFPDGLVLAADVDPVQATTCPNGLVLGDQGEGLLRLGAGATIPANGSCSVAVEVTAPSGEYVNTLDAGALVTDAGANQYAASATLQINPSSGTFPAPYCAAEFPDGVAPITHVIGAGIDNSSDGTIDGSPSLEDFTSIVGTVTPGETVAFTIVGNIEGVPLSFPAIYVDWNRDGLWSDYGEGYIGAVFDAQGSATIEVQVPSDALLGATRLRVVKSNAYPDICDFEGEGQAEDYTINVVAASCSAADTVFCDGFEGSSLQRKSQR